MEEAKEFFNKQCDDFRIEIPESLLTTTLKCLRNLRSYYNPYNIDDQEIIDAIHVLEEELHWNVLGIEGQTVTLSVEQFNQLLHYKETKNITTACNFVQSLVEQLEGKHNG